MKRNFVSPLAPPRTLFLALLLAGLGCTSSKGTQTLPPSTGLVSLVFTGNSSEDWSDLDFMVQGVTLMPAGGTTPITLLAPPSTGIPVNLVQLDHIGELMGNFGVPVGSYTSATLTLSPSTFALSVASVPSTGFLGTGNGDLKPSYTSVANPLAATTLSYTVPFASPLVVTTASTVVLDLDWDTLRPTFLNGAAMPNNGTVMWSVDFDSVLGWRPVADPAQVALLPVYGTVYEVASDQRSFQLSPSYAAGILGQAVVLPQTFVVRPDTVNGTLFNDQSSGTTSTLKDFSTVAAALPGRELRVGAQLQPDGSLLASRIWAGAALEMGTETSGRITAVDPVRGALTLDGADSTQDGYITGEWGMVSDTTALTLVNPESTGAPVAAVAAGAAFLAAGGFGRGFLVHPILHWAQNQSDTSRFLAMDIEAANFRGTLIQADGAIVTASCFTGNASGPASVTLPYLAKATPNGNDGQGNPITGFSWRTSANPSLVNSGAGATGTFAAAAALSVDFGGTVGALQPFATLHCAWADAANPSGWSAQYAILEPIPLPLGAVGAAWTQAGTGGSFGLTVPGGTNTVTVDVAGSAGVYQVYAPGPSSYFGGAPRLVAVDPTTAEGQATLAALLVAGAPAQVFGMASAGGHLQASMIFCYTYTE